MAGLAFKGSPETDDTRNSPTVDIHNALQNKFKNIVFQFHDPIVKRFSNSRVSATLKGCIKDSNVVMFLTNHPTLMNIDAEYVLKSTARPLLIIDCWHNLINLDRIKEKKVEIFRIGDKSL